MTKEEKIKEAYGECWSLMGPHVESNGWCINASCSNIWTIKDGIELHPSKSYSWRPKSLNGIENNNGWIKIHHDLDLPWEGCLIQVTNIENKDSNDAHWYRPGDFEYILSKWTHYRIIDNTKPLY